jgi:hypothetical protein
MQNSYRVRYDQAKTMLLNEFLREHHQVQDLKAIVAKQQAQIDGSNAGLQKMSAQLEENRLVPQVAVTGDRRAASWSRSSKNSRKILPSLGISR